MAQPKPRFNKTFVTSVVKRLYDKRSNELLVELPASADPTTAEQEAHKRVWGALQALYWMSAGYALEVVPPGHRTRFMDNGVPEKITKQNVATRIVNEATRLAKLHGFTSRTGWAQVKGKGSYMNRTYGFWEQLDTLIEELGLTEVPTRGQ